MATSPPPLTPFGGVAPQRGDKATFSGRVDAFVTWLIAVVAQFIAIAANVYANAQEAFISAGTATSAAAAAAAAANATPWVSGSTYGQNVAVISQVNFQTYRRVATGAGTTDPANDQTNWRLLAGTDSNGAFVPIPVTGTSIDCRLGNYFTDTMSANKTYTFDNCPPGGFSFTLELTLTAGVPVFPTSVKNSNNDSAPTLNTGKTHQLMYTTVNGGARWRVAVAPNYPT